MLHYNLTLLALTLLAGSLNAQKVKVDWDREADFSTYKTYKWSKLSSPRTPTEQIDKLIREHADVQLDAKGLKKIEDGEPDLHVGYWMTLGQAKQQGAEPAAPGSSWQPGRSWSGQTTPEQVQRQGTLNIEISDRRKQLLVWRGAVVADVGDSVNDARVKISQGLSKIFASYPPPAK